MILPCGRALVLPVNHSYNHPYNQPVNRAYNRLSWPPCARRSIRCEISLNRPTILQNGQGIGRIWP